MQLNLYGLRNDEYLQGDMLVMSGVCWSDASRHEVRWSAALCRLKTTFLHHLGDAAYMLFCMLEQSAEQLAVSCGGAYKACDVVC